MGIGLKRCKFWRALERMPQHLKNTKIRGKTIKQSANKLEIINQINN